MTRGGPVHFATIAHPLVAALQPRTEHTVTTDPMPVFTMTQREPHLCCPGNCELEAAA